MNSIYVSLEGMSLIITFILLYANLFEIKQSARKRNAFTRVLVGTALIVLSDSLTWIDLGWSKSPVIHWILISITYFVPFLVTAFIAEYIYEYISEEIEVKKLPFQTFYITLLVLSVITFIFCLTGKLFTIEGGDFLAGPWEIYYYVCQILSIVGYLVLLIYNHKILGLHDFIIASLFALLPFLSLLISAISHGITLSVPFLAVDTLVIYVFLHSDTENKLLFKSINDELTGLYNRRKYEEDLSKSPDIPTDKDFVYASIDLNGLKLVNDTLGHTAGDELICAAAQCLNKVFKKHGRVYRVGGDEFVAIFKADENKLQNMINELNQVTDNWHGTLIKSVAMSVGYATKREFPDKTVNELSIIADNRMYEVKKVYYSSEGMDRRGQQDAFKVLCSLYSKIIKINLTTDTYSIISMSQDDMLAENSRPEKISDWLQEFGLKGFIHSGDLDNYIEKTSLEYLRNYFKVHNKAFVLQYRRKHDDGYTNAIMEMVPSREYTDDNQSLFLYVKSIDA